MEIYSENNFNNFGLFACNDLPIFNIFISDEISYVFYFIFLHISNDSVDNSNSNSRQIVVVEIGCAFRYIFRNAELGKYFRYAFDFKEVSFKYFRKRIAFFLKCLKSNLFNQSPEMINADHLDFNSVNDFIEYFGMNDAVKS